MHFVVFVCCLLAFGSRVSISDELLGKACVVQRHKLHAKVENLESRPKGLIGIGNGLCVEKEGKDKAYRSLELIPATRALMITNTPPRFSTTLAILFSYENRIILFSFSLRTEQKHFLRFSWGLGRVVLCVMPNFPIVHAGFSCNRLKWGDVRYH